MDESKLIESARRILADGNCTGVGCNECPKAKDIEQWSPCADNALEESRPVMGLNDKQRAWFKQWLRDHEPGRKPSGLSDIDTIKRIVEQNDCGGISCESCIMHQDASILGEVCSGKADSSVALSLSGRSRMALDAWLAKHKPSTPSSTKVAIAKRMLEQGSCSGIACDECPLDTAATGCDLTDDDCTLNSAGAARLHHIIVDAERPDNAPTYKGLRVVTTIDIGARVVRGPDWVWGDQDGGEGGVGELVRRSSKGWAYVKWGDGTDNGYRVGADGKYDLCYASEREGGDKPGTKPQLDKYSLLSSMLEAKDWVSTVRINGVLCGHAITTFGTRVGQPTYTQSRRDIRARLMARIK